VQQLLETRLTMVTKSQAACCCIAAKSQLQASNEVDGILTRLLVVMLSSIETDATAKLQLADGQ